jgi:hypothetical protein
MMRGEDQPSNIPTLQRKKWRPSILVIVLVSLCCVALIGFTIYSVNLIKPEDAADQAVIQKLVDQFLTFLAAKDTQDAYDLFSTQAKINTPKGKLDDLISQNYSVLFFGYQRNVINSIDISSGLDLSSKAVDNRVAHISGTIYYEGGATGKYEAYFNRENNSWRIYTINFTIPQLISTPTEKSK